MNEAPTLTELLATEFIQASVWGVILNLVLAAFLSYWVGRMYVKYGRSLSNRRAFSHNFVLLTMTTMLVVTFVQSNLALSLGMIGALSIVRFRSAIKEPEELNYLFLCITLGLGLGASQRLLTVGALAVVTLVIRITHATRRHAEGEQNIFLTVSTHRPQRLSVEKISSILEENCSLYQMKRLDRTETVAEASFLLQLEEKNSLQTIESSLREADQSIGVTFLDYRGGMLEAA